MDCSGSLGLGCFASWVQIFFMGSDLGRFWRGVTIVIDLVFRNVLFHKVGRGRGEGGWIGNGAIGFFWGGGRG